jgi:[ribosomal protein S5]-alanine N-acetyltransferase
LSCILSTPRLSAHELSLVDTDFIFELLNTEDFQRHIGDRGASDLTGAKSYLLNGPIKSYSDNGFGLYLIRQGQDGVRVGIHGFLRRPGNEFTEIGYAYLPAHYNNGYATEMGLAFLEYAKNVLTLDACRAVVDPSNAASIRVLNKLGFTEISRTAQEIHFSCNLQKPTEVETSDDLIKKKGS